MSDDNYTKVDVDAPAPEDKVKEESDVMCGEGLYAAKWMCGIMCALILSNFIIFVSLFSRSSLISSLYDDSLNVLPMA